MKPSHVFIFIFAFMAGGCGNIYRTRHAQPSVSIRILKSDWELIASSIEDDLTHETQKMHPTGGSTTWPEFWQNRINNLRKGKSAGQAIAYIYRRRDELDLPPLSSQ